MEEEKRKKTILIIKKTFYIYILVLYRIAFIINITAKHYVDGHNGYSDYKSNLL